MLQKRYEGFLKTPCLWKEDDVYGLQQFKIDYISEQIDVEIDDNLRLGKYVERFVSFEIEQQPDISVLAENIQIQDGKTTLGEIDCLLKRNGKPIHLEVIYKFYLYDKSVGDTEIEHFIGPNRKDSLIEKLTKLREKQLPLLYTDACKPYLDKFDLKAKDITQEVYFKAQLFVPFAKQDTALKTLNPNCVVGFYINQNDLERFEDCKFFIPNKKDWLLEPHTYVNWLSFDTFKINTKNYFDEQFSTLCWVKFKTGELKKLFLVWW
ncbi:DUF1853 family protein [Algibacter pectinivorans]|uniref:DUF1853 domain-containing protein n=1 Tax=Algibacter pectinivorans TaxID=870482 RepID=A0A1I1MJQ2_9FLAO|nr:DUF1853 family protein [Algibacter pectinivorans]SFC85744.1 hypothetical protein SAMN04487987_101323 [Algibacter pectinivorans]